MPFSLTGPTANRLNPASKWRRNHPGTQPRRPSPFHDSAGPSSTERRTAIPARPSDSALRHIQQILQGHRAEPSHCWRPLPQDVPAEASKCNGGDANADPRAGAALDLHFFTRRRDDDGEGLRAALQLADEPLDALVAAGEAVVVDQILEAGLGVAALAEREFDEVEEGLAGASLRASARYGWRVRVGGTPLGLRWPVLKGPCG